MIENESVRDGKRRKKGRRTTEKSLFSNLEVTLR
jgi:hypothetical protein